MEMPTWTSGPYGLAAAAARKGAPLATRCKVAAPGKTVRTAFLYVRCISLHVVVLKLKLSEVVDRIGCQLLLAVTGQGMHRTARQR